MPTGGRESPPLPDSKPSHPRLTGQSWRGAATIRSSRPSFDPGPRATLIHNVGMEFRRPPLLTAVALACAIASTAPVAGQLASRPADEWIKTLDGTTRVATLKIDEVVAAMQLTPGQTVADIGAGTGLFSVPVAKAVGPRGRVFAVEIDAGFFPVHQETRGRQRCRERSDRPWLLHRPEAAGDERRSGFLPRRPASRRESRGLSEDARQVHRARQAASSSWTSKAEKVPTSGSPSSRFRASSSRHG